jgi:hypothetical protein
LGVSLRVKSALAVHAAQLAEANLEGLAVFAGRQLRAHQRDGNADAHARVGRAADDLEWAGRGMVRARIDAADSEAVGVGMLHGFDDLADHHLREGRRDRTHLLHLEAAQGEQLGEAFGGERRVAELAQPGFRELHGRGVGESVSGIARGSAGRRRRTGAGRPRHSAAS